MHSQTIWPNQQQLQMQPMGRRLIKLLQSKIIDILHPPVLAHTPQVEQSVREEEQRVIDETPILTVLRITDAPPTMQAQNPTAKRVLKDYTVNSLAIDSEQYPKGQTFDQ
jgi:hypothetical protein